MNPRGVECVMSYKTYKNTKTKRDYKTDHSSNGKGIKIVKRNYHVTSQTAYHIAELAFQEQTSEGRIIDKIVRSYLADRASRYYDHN